MALTLADDVVDQFLEGIDATDGSKVVDYGNYGVVYQLFLPAKAGEKFACYLSPRGGNYAGAISISYRHAALNPVVIPEDRLYFGNNRSKDFSFLGTYDGAASLWFLFSPLGCSNLPVKFIVMPVEQDFAGETFN